MVKYGYSYNKVHDPSRVAKSQGRELRISPKDAMEICREIRGKNLDDAFDYLDRVIDGITAVPYKTHSRKLAHKKSLNGWHSGKFPVKASEAIIELLENAQNNAKYKGLDEAALFVRHASARKGFEIRGFKHRARGRVNAFNTPTTNIEIWLGEK
jgi:large subunit ribosomal protein L22